MIKMTVITKNGIVDESSWKIVNDNKIEKVFDEKVNDVILDTMFNQIKINLICKKINVFDLKSINFEEIEEEN